MTAQYFTPTTTSTRRPAQTRTAVRNLLRRRGFAEAQVTGPRDAAEVTVTAEGFRLLPTPTGLLITWEFAWRDEDGHPWRETSDQRLLAGFVQHFAQQTERMATHLRLAGYEVGAEYSGVRVYF